ncbi:MAG: hypothetical protein ACOYN0_20365, partial [Phycisphaerales bacterium]
PRARALLTEGRERLEEASAGGMAEHPSLIRNLGSLEVDSALMFAGQEEASVTAALADRGLARFEAAARRDPLLVMQRRDWGYQLAAYGRAARAIVDAAPADARALVCDQLTRRLEASIAEFRAQPMLDLGKPDSESLAAAAEALLRELRGREGR